MTITPEITLSRDHATAIAELRDQWGALDGVEEDLLGPRLIEQRLDALLRSELRSKVVALWAKHDHVVVRNVPPADDGSTGLLIGALLFRTLKAYRAGRVIKRFQMSPWTTALSHTLAQGSFHTDINTAEQPPAGTLTQCLVPDPDAPTHGQLRVARFHDLLAALRADGATAACRLLTDDHVVMVNDASPTHWSGRIFDGHTVRFHPETLRAAQRRLASNPPDLEEILQVIHDASMAVSSPIELAAGEILIVSNRRALHQRGACTVRFRSFPRDFETRSVAVMHVMDEPS